jgi:SRSO17 transposase
VSLALARDGVPVDLRLFLPQAWATDAARCAKAAVPEERQQALAKTEIALIEIDRAAAGARFGMSSGAASPGVRGRRAPLMAGFTAVRVCPAEGEQLRQGRHLPGEEVWLVGEQRSAGERKYYLSNLPADTSLEELAATIKASWLCEQAHQQMKEEPGQGHFEGRSP